MKVHFFAIPPMKSGVLFPSLGLCIGLNDLHDLQQNDTVSVLDLAFRRALEVSTFSLWALRLDVRISTTHVVRSPLPQEKVTCRCWMGNSSWATSPQGASMVRPVHPSYEFSPSCHQPAAPGETPSENSLVESIQATEPWEPTHGCFKPVDLGWLVV